MYKRKLFIYILVFGLSLVLFYLALASQAPELWAAFRSGNQEEVRRFLSETTHSRGMFFLGLLQFFQLISIILPATPVQIAGGMVYGALRGFIVCHVMFVAANAVVFVAVRRFSGLSEFIGSGNREKLQKAIRFLNYGDPFVNVIIMCLVPVVPNGLIPYAATQMRLSALEFTTAVWFGSFVPILAMVSLGKFILMGQYVPAALCVAANFVVMLLCFTQRHRISNLFSKYVRRGR